MSKELWIVRYFKFSVKGKTQIRILKFAGNYCSSEQEAFGWVEHSYNMCRAYLPKKEKNTYVFYDTNYREHTICIMGKVNTVIDRKFAKLISPWFTCKDLYSYSFDIQNHDNKQWLLRILETLKENENNLVDLSLKMSKAYMYSTLPKGYKMLKPEQIIKKGDIHFDDHYDVWDRELENGMEGTKIVNNLRRIWLNTNGKMKPIGDYSHYVARKITK